MATCGFRGAISLCVVVLAWSPLAWSQETTEYVPEQASTEVVPNQGWDFALRAAISGSLATSSLVIGSVDGNTWTLGLGLEGAATFLAGSHEMRNTLSITEALTRTPVVDEFVKSTDTLDLEDIYFYHLPTIPWFGPFVRFRLNNSLFPGNDVRATAVTYNIAHVDGTVESVTADRLDLTDAMVPLMLKESAGFFARPETDPEFQFEQLLGFGARETFADSQLAVQDIDTTAEIEVIELQSFVQAGAETVTRVWGELEEGRVAYNAGAEFMVPFINDLAPDDTRDAFELTNIELSAGLTFAVLEWLTIDYEFGAIREPQLLDDFQIRNSLLLSIGYTFVDTEAERAAEAPAP